MSDKGFDIGRRTPKELRKIPPTIEMRGFSQPSERHPEINEDSLFFFESARVFGIFDGVSQGGKGKIAADLARDYVRDNLFARPPGMSADQVEGYLIRTLVNANALVSQRARFEGEMSTTASVGIIWEGTAGERKLIVANVGDSRVYLLRNGKLQQITLDDNYVRGLSATEAKARELQAKFNNTTNPQAQLTAEDQNLIGRRNIVTQAVGAGRVEPRVHVVDLKSRDIILACSDGISDYRPGWLVGEC